MRYWQGFALWRKAINGFQRACRRSEGELEATTCSRRSGNSRKRFGRIRHFVDAGVGIISCSGYLLYLQREDPARVQELVSGLVQMLKDALAAAPENPRVLWVQGPSLWYARPGLSKSEVAERRASALRRVEKGLGSRSDNRQRGSVERNLTANLDGVIPLQL